MTGEVVRLALTALRAHRLRSTLTVLSIAIGVASVILLMSIGAGLSAMIRAEAEAFSSATTLTVTQRHDLGPAQEWDELGRPLEQTEELDFDSWTADAEQVVAAPLTATDVEVVRQTAGVVAAAGIVSSYGEVAAVLDGVPSPVPADQVIGTGPGYEVARGWTVAHGSFLPQPGGGVPEAVAVLGDTLAQQLFGDASAALDGTVRHLGTDYRVVGVLAPSGGPEWGTGDMAVVVPEDVLRGDLPAAPVGYEHVLVEVGAADEVPQVRADLLVALHRAHGLLATQPPDVEVLTMTGDLAFVELISLALQGLGLALASVSLAVGGIGVMNMMLVSVTERTREIGLRSALGARPGHLMGQFLVEAVVLCLVGGLLGLAVGSLGQLVEIQGFRPVVTPLAVTLALGCAVGTGVLFGWLPARRAARMSPVEALRHE